MKLTNKLTAIVAALFAAGCEPTGQTPKQDPLEMYSSYSQFKRKPDKVVTGEFAEVILLHDFDGDGKYDMEEIIGRTPGAYWVQVTPSAMERYIRIKVVSPAHFDIYEQSETTEKSKEK